MASIAALHEDGLHFPDENVIGGKQAEGYYRRCNQGSHRLPDYLAERHFQLRRLLRELRYLGVSAGLFGA